MESNRDYTSEDIPKAEEDNLDVSLNVDVEINQTPPVSEPNLIETEIFADTDVEFLDQIKSWTKSAQQNKALNTTKNFKLIDIFDLVKFHQRNPHQVDYRSLATLHWQKCKIEIRKRRERVLINVHRLSKLSSKLSNKSKCTCNQNTLTHATFQDISDLFEQNRTEKQLYKKLNTKRCKKHKSWCPRFQSKSKAQSSGYSADESSFDDLTDLEDLDVSLTNVWNEWNMPSPTNIDISDTSSVESLI